MEDTGAASRGRAAQPPREGRGGRWGGGRRRGTGRRRAAQGRPCGGPSPALPNGPTSPSKNQVAVKSDQSACPPQRQDRVCVVVPKYDFKHGMKTLLWALLNVAKNGERLFIVHVHRGKRISPKGVEEKLGDYVSMCNASKVICDLKIIENCDVAKALAEFIDREGITKLVIRGAADKRYSEEMKSPEFNQAIKLMKSAPLTCKIWFTCNGQLICTREANATVPAIQPPPVDSHALKMEPVAAVTEAGGLYEKNDQQNAMTLPAETVNTEFSEDEIEKSINCLDNRLIGKGGSGNVYKGRLRNTDVAIKKLHRESMQEESDFSRKVAVLGRVRHPNLVTLIGVCREALCLVYEFLPNGSLQDWLACNNKMPPLTWQVRTKIIYEMCSALIFLHSNEPQPVVHGDLKPSNVLLDANFVSKVGDFGICMDGDPTTQSDVHSFGVIILQLLTRLPPEDVAKVVEDAMEKEELHTVLDPTAGNWPIALAKQLADVGLRCVKMSREERPDLVGDVWKELESHKNNAGILTSGQDDVPPNYFICPITRDVMENPHFAADGHTYELMAILQWIHGDDGKSSDRSVRSPMTNLKLEHFELTPNLALNSEIREWKEKQQQKQVRSLVCDPHPVPVQNSDVHTIIITPEEEAQSQPPIGLLPQVSSSPPTTVIPSLTDDAGSSSLTLSPNTALLPASSSPPTTLIPSTADARSGRSTAPAPLNTSAAARSHRLNPLPANPSAAAPPPPRPVSPSSTDFLPPPTGIRRRRVNGRLPSSSTEPDVPAGPGETSRIRGKFKHE